MCTDTARYARTSTGLDVLLSFPFVRVYERRKKGRKRKKRRKEGKESHRSIGKIEKQHGYPPSFHLSRRTNVNAIDGSIPDISIDQIYRVCTPFLSPSPLPSFLTTPPNTTPFIESFRGKISNVLASFLRSFLFHVHLFNEVFFLAPTVPLFFFSCLCPSRGQKENVISPACVISTTLWALASKRDRRSLPLSSLYPIHPTLHSPPLPPRFPPARFPPSFFHPLPSPSYFFLLFFDSFFLFSFLPSSLPLFSSSSSFSLFSLVADDCCSRPLLPCSSLPMTRFTESPGVKRFMPRWATFIPARRRLRLRSRLKGTTTPPRRLRALDPPRQPPTHPPSTAFVFSRDLKFVLPLHPLIATRRNVKKVRRRLWCFRENSEADHSNATPRGHVLFSSSKVFSLVNSSFSSSATDPFCF